MKLNDTIEMMTNEDYKERFKAEFHQLSIRLESLKTMTERWDAGLLDFKPTCPRSTYDLQINAMTSYLAVLETRAVMEGIELNDVR